MAKMIAISVHRRTAHTSGRGRRCKHEPWSVDWDDARDRVEHGPVRHSLAAEVAFIRG